MNASTRSAMGNGGLYRTCIWWTCGPLDGLNSRGRILSSCEEPEIESHGSGLDDWIKKPIYKMFPILEHNGILGKIGKT